MRGGRLIFPVLAEIQPFAGASSQDPDFQEPAQGCSGETPKTYRLPCQVEPDENEVVNMYPDGNAPRTQLHLVFHESGLRKARCPAVRDKLVGFYTLQGYPIDSYGHRPGLEAVEVRPLSFGLRRGRTQANLLRVTFRDASAGVRSVER